MPYSSKAPAEKQMAVNLMYHRHPKGCLPATAPANILLLLALISEIAKKEQHLNNNWGGNSLLALCAVVRSESFLLSGRKLFCFFLFCFFFIKKKHDLWKWWGLLCQHVGLVRLWGEGNSKQKERSQTLEWQLAWPSTTNPNSWNEPCWTSKSTLLASNQYSTSKICNCCCIHVKVRKY